jgi:hypothetical protein
MPVTCVSSWQMALQCLADTLLPVSAASNIVSSWPPQLLTVTTPQLFPLLPFQGHSSQVVQVYHHHLLFSVLLDSVHHSVYPLDLLVWSIPWGLNCTYCFTCIFPTPSKSVFVDNNLIILTIHIKPALSL